MKNQELTVRKRRKNVWTLRIGNIPHMWFTNKNCLNKEITNYLENKTKYLKNQGKYTILVEEENAED